MIRRHQAPLLIASAMCLSLAGSTTAGDQAPARTSEATVPAMQENGPSRTQAQNQTAAGSSRPTSKSKLPPGIKIDPKHLRAPFPLPDYVQKNRPKSNHIIPGRLRLRLGLVAVGLVLLPFVLIAHLIKWLASGPKRRDTSELSES
jgi:hypothetical protein